MSAGQPPLDVPHVETEIEHGETLESQGRKVRWKQGPDFWFWGPQEQGDKGERREREKEREVPWTPGPGTTAKE